MKRFRPVFDAMETRVVPTLVFVFPGNALAAANTDSLTQQAADALAKLGDQAIQVSTPAMSSASVIYGIANEIRQASHGRPIGLMGFSAGGMLATRLAGMPGLNVKSVMDYYGPPDFKDWLKFHGDDQTFQYVATHVQLTKGVVQLFSGPSDTQAFVVGAFGLHDTNVNAHVSATSLEKDFQHEQVFYYRGPHGVSLYANYGAFLDFVHHL
jgi:hypothetical protein